MRIDSVIDSVIGSVIDPVIDSVIDSGRAEVGVVGWVMVLK